jgi:hypothetical protein
MNTLSLSRPVVAAALLLAGCARTSAAPAAETRAEWLRRALVEHERPALARDPALVSAKFARMAHDTFAFFRGTPWLVPPEPSHFTSPASLQVAVMGDPHPENVGTFQPPDAGGARVIDFNDFDLAGHGSYVDDLRRLALGFWIISDMADLKHKQRRRVVDELVDGYTGQIRELTAGRAAVSLRPGSFSGDIDEILTPPDAERASAGRETAASTEESALARALLQRYPATLYRPAAYKPAMFAVKSVVRLAAGISSFPTLRLRARVEGPTPSPDDDWILELKESSERPAAEVVALQRQFQEFPDDDPLLGWAQSDGRQFRVRQIGPAHRRLDAERIAKQVKSPQWKKSDLKDLARDLGRLLARGHARARGRDGQPGLAAIAAAIGDGPGLRDETAAFAERRAALTEGDLRLFRRLLSDSGPTLGWSPPAR